MVFFLFTVFSHSSEPEKSIFVDVAVTHHSDSISCMYTWLDSISKHIYVIELMARFSILVSTSVFRSETKIKS